jgi:fructosamine-3-kinase
VSGASIQAALADRLGLTVHSIALINGGDINDAYHAETDRGPVFVKTSKAAQPGMFSDEAAGLGWLAQPGGVDVPRVIGVCDEEDAELPRLLALEWIEQGRLSNRGEQELGRGLAQIHLAGAPAFGATPSPAGGYGHSPMRFNDLSLPNDPRATWAQFYGENRLLALGFAAHAAGHLPAEDVARVERLAERLPELAGPEEPPARTHGDLWAGNVIADSTGTPYLIDPVAHGGHREVDLALLSVFGGPSQRCFDAYDEVFPRADGHAERTGLWQLAMILLHVHLFGGSYVQQARELTSRYL